MGFVPVFWEPLTRSVMTPRREPWGGGVGVPGPAWALSPRLGWGDPGGAAQGALQGAAGAPGAAPGELRTDGDTQARAPGGAPPAPLCGRWSRARRLRAARRTSPPKPRSAGVDTPRPRLREASQQSTSGTRLLTRTAALTAPPSASRSREMTALSFWRLRLKAPRLSLTPLVLTARTAPCAKPVSAALASPASLSSGPGQQRVSVCPRVPAVASSRPPAPPSPRGPFSPRQPGRLSTQVR